MTACHPLSLSLGSISAAAPVTSIHFWSFQFCTFIRSRWWMNQFHFTDRQSAFESFRDDDERTIISLTLGQFIRHTHRHRRTYTHCNRSNHHTTNKCCRTFSFVVAQTFDFWQFGEKLTVTFWKKERNNEFRLIKFRIDIIVWYVLYIMCLYGNFSKILQGN